MSASRVVGLIPARFESSRFPGKPLAEIQGKPMIIHVAERVSEALGHDNTFVITDSQLIHDTVVEWGFSALIQKGDFRNGTERIAAAVLDHKSALMEANVFVNVQGDEPLVQPSDIRAVVDRKLSAPEGVAHGFSRVTSWERLVSRSVPKVVISRTGRLLYASRLPIPGSKFQQEDVAANSGLVQVCIYAFSEPELSWFISQGAGPNELAEDIEILRFVENDRVVNMVPVTETIAVDYPEDLDRVKQVIEGI